MAHAFIKNDVELLSKGITGVFSPYNNNLAYLVYGLNKTNLKDLEGYKYGRFNEVSNGLFVDDEPNAPVLIAPERFLSSMFSSEVVQ